LFGDELGIGVAGERILLAHLHELERIFDERIEPPIAEIARP
jgi:hypothetical protein